MNLKCVVFNILIKKNWKHYWMQHLNINICFMFWFFFASYWLFITTYFHFHWVEISFEGDANNNCLNLSITFHGTQGHYTIEQQRQDLKKSCFTTTTYQSWPWQHNTDYFSTCEIELLSLNWQISLRFYSGKNFKGAILDSCILE